MTSLSKTLSMKKWCKYGLTLIVIIIIVFIGVFGNMGYSMTSQERKPLDKNPVLVSFLLP